MAHEPSEMAGWALPDQGEFVWTEIGVDKADKCMEFYRIVFGWKFTVSKATDEDMQYNEFSTGGDQPAGGLYEINPAWFDGTPPPPHFMSYIAADDVDENAKLAVELGGTILRGPMDIPNVGRMCIIKDPTGAVFSTFQMKN